MALNVCNPIVDLSECLRDSPKFRDILSHNEAEIDSLEIKTDKIVKLCTSMVETGKAFIKAKSNFISGISELLVFFKTEPMVSHNLNRLMQTQTELLKYDSILIDQANRGVAKNLTNFIREDIYKVKETKRHFDKISDDLDNVLTRHSQAPKSKTNECEEANNILTATRSCFQHTALDYVAQISCLKNKRKHEILDSLMCLMHAYGTYFHQGSDLFQDFEVIKKEMTNNITNMRDETNLLDKKLENRHTLVSSKDIIPTLIKSDKVRLEGYLFKRTTNAFKTWNRRWFIIQDHQLVYHKRKHDKELTVMEEDLRLCTAKPVAFMERRFCFEVLSPSKSHILQADSEEACQQWIAAMQAGIDAAYNNDQIEAQSIDSQDSWCTASSNSTSKSSSSINSLTASVGNPNPLPKPPRVNFMQITAVSGNEFCCDCRCADPKWTSINLGITLCIECSGIHRSLGVHLSKVRSLNLDAWDLELIKIMTSLGNNIVNSIYEAKVDESIALRATPDCDRSTRENWIKAKYVKKAFVDKSDNLINSKCSETADTLPNRMSDKEMNESLCDTKDADHNEDTSKNGCAMSEHSDKDEQLMGGKCWAESDKLDEQSDAQQSSCADVNYNLMLHKAALNHDLPRMSEALAKGALINWCNADHNNRTALHQAISSDTVIACEFLLLNGAKCNIADMNGVTPLLLATELGNTGQVCLLLKRGADQSSVDSNGNDALTVAINNANADIVTLLRLAKLNEEMKNDEYGNPNDETFNEVVKDFSQLASHSPQKLRRQNLNNTNS